MPRRDDIIRIDIDVPEDLCKRLAKVISERRFSFELRMILSRALPSNAKRWKEMASIGKRMSTMPSRRMTVEFQTSEIKKLDKQLRYLRPPHIHRRHALVGLISLLADQ